MIELFLAACWIIAIAYFAFAWWLARVAKRLERERKMKRFASYSGYKIIE